MAALLPYAFASSGAFAIVVIAVELSRVPAKLRSLRARINQIEARRVRITIRTIKGL